MKTGDTVVIKDGSYTRSIIDGELVREFLNSGEAKGRHYTVVETGCSFPPVDHLQPERYRNDTVIQDDSGKVVLVHSGFLRVVKPKHVWKHGDVFTWCGDGSVMIYLEVNSGPVVYTLRSEPECLADYHPVQACLSASRVLNDATFLFNVKDRL